MNEFNVINDYWKRTDGTHVGKINKTSDNSPEMDLSKQIEADKLRTLEKEMDINVDKKSDVHRKKDEKKSEEDETSSSEDGEKAFNQKSPLVKEKGNVKQCPELETEDNEVENIASGMKTHLKSDADENVNKETFNAGDIKDHPKGTSNSNVRIIDDEVVCGYGCFRPQWIQKFATAKIFLFFFSILSVIEGMHLTYFTSIISTLEKRFGLDTKVTTSLLLAEEIIPLIFAPVVGYLGSKVNRTRWIALGKLLVAAGCFMYGIPFFIYGPAEHLIFENIETEKGHEMCKSEANHAVCDADDRPSFWVVIGILMSASFMKGFSNVTHYIFGFSYIDDGTKKKSSPMYLAIAMALRLLGPLCGFIMSSAFLKIYENPLDDPGFGPDDPRWIGAWWMGFFLQGVLLVIFTLPIALFPRRLPNQKKIEKFPTAGPENNIKETLAGLLLALKRLGKNPIFIVLIINTNMKIFGHFGHSIMLPKYMENQFRLSAADASLYSGATSITCIMLSTVFGGFLIWKFRPRIKVLLGGMITSEVVLCVGFLVLMIPRCSPADMLHFGTNDDGLILDSVCNQNCDCSTVSFTPFCGPDGKTTYFSPCYAGCTEEFTQDIKLPPSNKQKEFGNCSCVNTPDSLVSNPAKITEGFCPDESCWSQTLAYLIILFFLLAISNTLTVAHTMILLRSVHPADKSVALGTFETFICLFGFIPFPITYGALVDSACLIWEESCGETGNCWFYDMEKYTYLLHGASAFFCSLSTICLITLYFLSNRVKNLYVEEDEEEEYIDNIKLDTVSGSVTKL